MFGIAAQQLSRAAPRVASRSVGCRGGAIFVGIVEELGLIREPLTIYLCVARSCRDSELLLLGTGRPRAPQRKSMNHIQMNGKKWPWKMRQMM